MAKIILGVGTSHTPLLALTSEQWIHRADVDRANPALTPLDGRTVDYDTLLAETEGRYAPLVTPDILAEKERICQASLDRIADEIEAANPDVVVIVGDDQSELFGNTNQPSVALFHGEEIVTYEGRFAAEDTPDWQRDLSVGYLMDRAHRVPAAPEFALELITSLMDQHIDLATVAHVEDPMRAGFGHAYGFVIKRLFHGKKIPVVPLMLNTYYPPNVPSAARCYDIGRALRQAIESSTKVERVAVIASGGLSHFVVDEDFDRSMLHAMEQGDAETLRGASRAALRSGTSETLNWILTAGALEGIPVRWHEYQPLIRTPAGTGVGAAFCVWRP